MALIRATVDTNVWTRAYLNIHSLPGRVVTALREERFRLVTSEPLLHEVQDVLARPRVARKHGQPPELVRSYTEAIRDAAELTDVTGEVAICRDPDGDAVIETAERGRVDYLVTEDKDLQTPEVRTYLLERGVEVVNVIEFLAALERPAE